MLASSSVEFGELDRTRNQGFHMDLEIRRFEAADHLVYRLPKCRYFSRGGDGDKLASGDDDDGEDEIFDFSEAESLLVDSVPNDDKAELVAHARGFVGAAGEDLERSTAAKLLHHCCNFDTADLAHSARCVNVLLERHARTVLRTRDGLGQQVSSNQSKPRRFCFITLIGKSMDVVWNSEDHSVEALVVVHTEKDFTPVRLLGEKTKEIGDVAYAHGVEAHIVNLAALRIVAAEKVNESVLELRNESCSREKGTVYEWLIREALSLNSGTPPCRVAKSAWTAAADDDDANPEKRKVLLLELELLQLFGAVAQSGCTDKKVTPPLIRAAQLWIKIFKKWFPCHLEDLLKNPNNGHYALPSLTTDLKAKFGLQLDYKSLGFSKLSDFVKSFSNLFTVKIFSEAKYGSPTHMIIQPNPRPRHQLSHTFRTPCSSLLSASTDNGGNSKSLQDISYDDGGESKYQDISVDDGSDSKCHEDISVDGSAASKYLEDISVDGSVDSKCLQDLSMDVGGVPKCLQSSTPREDMGRNLVLESLTRKWNKSPGYFLRNFDFNKVGVEKQTGTTNVVFLWQNCAFVGVDTRGTSIDIPRLILQDDAHKVARLDYNLLATIQGASDYCSNMLRYVHDIIVENRKAGKVEDALTVANHARKYINDWRLRHSKEFPASTLIVGYGGDEQVQVHHANGNGCDNDEGDGKFFVAGSGKIAAKRYKAQYPDPIDREEAIKTVERALLHAALEDPLTGGSIQVYEVKRYKCDTVSEKKVLPLILEHYGFIASRLSCCMIVVWFECYLKYDSNSHKLVEEALKGFVHDLRSGVILARLRTCTLYLLELDAESTVDQLIALDLTYPYNLQAGPNAYPHLHLDIPLEVRQAGWKTLPVAIERGNMPIICARPTVEVFEFLLHC